MPTNIYAPIPVSTTINQGYNEPSALAARQKARRMDAVQEIEEQKRQTLSEIGSFMANKDLDGAANAAFGAGMNDVGLKIRQYSQKQESAQQASQTKFASWFSQNGRRIGDDPQKLEAFKRAVPMVSQQLGLGDGGKFDQLTMENIDEALVQMEMLVFEREPKKAPEMKEIYRDGRKQKIQWNGQEWVDIGGTAAPKTGQRVYDTEGNLIFEQGGSGSAYAADPKLKKDFRRVKDSEGALTGSVEPIPGSATWKKWRDEEKRSKDKRLAAQRDSRILIDYADRTLKLIDDDPNTAAGPIAYAAQWLPGTAAYNAKWMIRTLQAKGAFDKLQEIRDNSKTGGAVGQLSDDERRALSDSMAQLEQSLNYEMLRYNLVQFRARYLDAAYGDIEGVYGYTWVEIEAQMERTGKTREQILDDIAENATPRKP